MCVTLILSPIDKHARLDGDELAAATGLLVRRKAAGAYELCPKDGCPCDFVGTGRATDAEWALRDEFRPALAAALKLAARRLKRFRLTATWLNDPVSSESTVTLGEMLKIVETGGVGRRSFHVAGG
jgi:hypothetical protein